MKKQSETARIRRDVRNLKHGAKNLKRVQKKEAAKSAAAGVKAVAG